MIQVESGEWVVAMQRDEISYPFAPGPDYNARSSARVSQPENENLCRNW